MNTKPTYGHLQPVEMAPFSRHQRTADRARAKRQRDWGQPVTVNPLPAAFDAKTLVQPTAVAAIRKAFTLAKTSRDAWKSVQREGRFDIRQAPRVSRGAQDVFKRKSGQSTTKVKISVLIDASGSMNTMDAFIPHPTDQTPVRVSRSMAAAVFGATIAEALGRVPTVDLDVFQHAAGGSRLHIKWRWTRGTPVAAFNESMYGIGGGGNADGHALYAITTRMQREIRRGERGIIMVVSDGLPSVYAHDATAQGPERAAGQALIDAVAHARKAGFTVIGVAIDGSDQTVYYDKGTLPFTGNWNALGSALARLVGDALAVKR